MIDPDAASGKSLRMALAPQHRVHLSRDLSQALALAPELDVDVVTLDPEAHGLGSSAVLGAVRDSFAAAEIVVVTGTRSLESALAGIRHGVFDYLLKPFDVCDLRASVEAARIRHDERRSGSSPLAAPPALVVPERPHATTICRSRQRHGARRSADAHSVRRS